MLKNGKLQCNQECVCVYASVSNNLAGLHYLHHHQTETSIIITIFDTFSLYWTTATTENRSSSSNINVTTTPLPPPPPFPSPPSPTNMRTEPLNTMALFLPCFVYFSLKIRYFQLKETRFFYFLAYTFHSIVVRLFVPISFRPKSCCSVLSSMHIAFCSVIFCYVMCECVCADFHRY